MDNLRKYRDKCGFQRRFISESIGITGKHLNDVEAGRVNLTNNVAGKLADVYGLNVDIIKKMYKAGK